jgi:glutathione S-transferase
VQAAVQESVQVAANDLEAVEPIFNGFTTEADKIDAYYEEFALRCGQLEKLLGLKPFYGGDSVGFADFTFFHFYDLAQAVRPAAGTPALNAWAARVRALPAVAAEIAARPPAGPSAA